MLHDCPQLQGLDPDCASGSVICCQQVANAQKGGAAAAIIYNDEEDGFVKMTADSGWSGVAITMPSAFIPASTARPLLQAMLAGASLTATFSALTLPTNRWESLAYFSSVGPTLDGRYKPDLIAPGTTISPYSDESVSVPSHVCACMLVRRASSFCCVADLSGEVSAYYTMHCICSKLGCIPSDASSTACMAACAYSACAHPQRYDKCSLLFIRS